MINLTPISKRIQNRLFEKMDVLGREAGKGIPFVSMARGTALDLNQLSPQFMYLWGQ